MTEKGEIDTNTPGPAEIAAAVLTPALASCPTADPHVFVSYSSSSVLRASLSSMGYSGGPLALLPEGSLPITASCIGSLLPGYPPSPYGPLYGYPIQPGGIPYLQHSSGTDNVMARLPTGNLLEVGGIERACRDPISETLSGCPTTAPAEGSACSTGTNPPRCSYKPITPPGDGTDRVCGCYFNPAADIPAVRSGMGPDVTITGTAVSAALGLITVTNSGALGTALMSWSYGAQSGTSVPIATTVTLGTTGQTANFPAGNYVAGTTYSWTHDTWHCLPRRLEAAGLGVRLSNDCGGNWDARTVFPYELGVTGGRAVNRFELYVDPYEDRFFISSYAGAGATANRVIIVKGSPKTATNLGAMSFSVYRDEERSGLPAVVTTVLDEKARLPGGTFGRWVHVVTARCTDPPDKAPLVDIQTPFGLRVVDLSLGRSADFICDNAKSLPIQNGFTYNRSPNITAVGIPSVPPRVRVVYHGIRSDGAQVVHSFLVTLSSRNGYDAAAMQAQLVHEFTLEDTAGSRDMALPALMGVDGLAGSDALTDTPMVLRYARADPNTVNARATVIYSGLRRSTDLDLGSSNFSQMFVGACPGMLTQSNGWTNPCAFGDYEYGAFFDKSASGELRFFTPYGGQSLAMPPAPGIFAIGTVVDVAP